MPIGKRWPFIVAIAIPAWAVLGGYAIAQLDDWNGTDISPELLEEFIPTADVELSKPIEEVQPIDDPEPNEDLEPSEDSTSRIQLQPDEPSPPGSPQNRSPQNRYPSSPSQTSILETLPSSDEQSIRPGLDIPAVDIPSDPQDITTPPSPPTTLIPDNARPIESRSARSLELPSNPLEVRVERVVGLSLAEAMDLAIERNPEIERSRQDVIISRRQRRAIIGEYFPQVFTNTRFTHTRFPRPGDGSSGFEGLNEFLGDLGIDDRVTAGTDRGAQSSVSGTLRVSLTLYDGSRRGRRQSASREITAAELQLEAVTEELRLNTAEAYYDLQRADTQVLVADAGLQDSQTSLRNAEALLEVGLGTYFEVLQATTRVANNQEFLLRQQDVRDRARFELAALLNFDETIVVASIDPIVPKGEWPLTLEETVVEAFNNRPEFDILRKQIESRRYLANSNLARTRPSFDVFASYDYLDDFDDRFNITDGYTIGGNFNWTIFDGGTERARAQEQRAISQQLAADFEQLRNDIRREIESAFFSLDNSRSRIEVSKLALDSAQEQLRLARLRFQTGLGTQTDVLQAEEELTIARGGLAESITEYNINLARLERATNRL